MGEPPPAESQGTETEKASENSSPQKEIDALERAHQMLIGAYVDVLNALSKVPPFPSWRDTDPPESAGELFSVARRRLLTWRFIVGLSAEAHVRAKCDELGSAFAREAQKRDEPGRGRVAKMQESYKAVAESLSSLQRTKLLLPTIGGLSVTALLGVLGLGVTNVWPDLEGFARYMNSDWTHALAGVPVLVAVACYLFYIPGVSFGYKRLVFLGHPLSPMKVRRSTAGEEPPEWRVNIYEAESSVAELLGRRKKDEVRYDLVLAFLGTALLVGYVPLTVCICFLHRWWTLAYAAGMVIVGVGLLFLGWALWRRGRRRRWR